jgi:uncharacterized repeat protein (TIGR01451 family)
MAQTLTITARVVSPDAQTNTASISHSDQFDPDKNNNSSSVTETPQKADLALAKRVDNTHPNVGDTITYTVTLSDIGPDNATGVTVQDLLPAGLTYVGSNPSQGTYDQTTGVWDVGIVTTTTPLTLTIQAKVASSAAQTNTASISHADQFDPDTGNNSASVTEAVQQADLVLVKQVSPMRQMVGFDVTYTLNLHNVGPDTATNVVVTDTFPAGLTIVGPNTASQGKFDPATGIWTVGTLPVGVRATLTVTARVDVLGPIANTASATGDQFDPMLANSTSTASLVGQMPPGLISKRFFLSGATVMGADVQAVPAALRASPAAAPLLVAPPSAALAAQAPLASLISATPRALNAPTTLGSPILVSAAEDTGPAGGTLPRPLVFSENVPSRSLGGDVTLPVDRTLPVDEVMAEWGQGTFTDGADWLGAPTL